MRLRGGISAQVEANPTENWLNASESAFTSGEALHSARPQLTVSIPLPSHPTSTPIGVTATLTITYPLADGSVQQETLTRDFTLTIIGGDYYYYYSRYQDWERARSVIETPLWLVLVVGSVLAGAGSVYFIREGALVPQATGGLQMVIRRLSGFQKLGTDVHPIERFRDRTGVDQGVFVGRVIAQSPAGRAGFRTGDVLIELDGKPTNSPSAVNRIAKGHNKGDIVPAVVLRDGVRIDLRVRF
jgi:membrane-associated protease RseP (regulator of RpoE activity)